MKTPWFVKLHDFFMVTKRTPFRCAVCWRRRKETEHLHRKLCPLRLLLIPVWRELRKLDLEKTEEGE